jgi:hypothetical protein
MKLTVYIDLDNSALTDDPKAITLVLSQVARAMAVVPCGPNGATGPLMDSNGNTGGTWTVTL